MNSGYNSDASEGNYKQALTQAHLNKAEIIIADKLGYEWKNIYRNLVQSSNNDGGCIGLTEFDNVCYQFKVCFTKDELVRISKLAAVEQEEYNMRTFDTIQKDRTTINFRKLSAQLCIHKDSYNHLNGNMPNSSRIAKLFKLREQSNSIEPVIEEEDCHQGDDTLDIEEQRRPKTQGQKVRRQKIRSSLIKTQSFVNNKQGEETNDYQNTNNEQN